MVDGDARYESDQSEAEDVRRGVEVDASIATYEQKISEPGRGGKLVSVPFAPYGGVYADDAGAWARACGGEGGGGMRLQTT